jgi:hypothetical protein
MKLALFMLLVAIPALADINPRKLGDGCLPSCETGCLKPFAIPDRWDDSTNVAGYASWNKNGRFDSEKVTNDVNFNGLYDPGDQYGDANGNGQYDAETYHPLFTGYIPDSYPGNKLSPNGDLGLQLVLKEGDPGVADKNNYFAIALPAINRGTPHGGASAYRAALEGCTGTVNWPGDWLEPETGRMTGPTIAGTLALIAKDPAARFDPATGEIVGSIYPNAEGPRVVIVGLTDPRISMKSGKVQVQITKMVGFFIEEVDDQGTVRGRFLKVRNPGPPCTCCGKLEANWLLNCP